MTRGGRYDAISLDAGYTLIRPVQEAPLIVARRLQQIGVEAAPEQLTAAWRRAERLFLDDYLAPESLTWTSDVRIQTLYERYYTQLLGDLGVEDPERTHARAIISAYNDPENWVTYTGVPEVLAELARRNYRLGIVSDWVSGLPRILHRLDLSRYLDWVLVSGAIGFSKPSPALYGLAARRAGTLPDRMLHVGDSYYADVMGARAAGMHALLIDWRGRTWPRLDVGLINSISELLTLLP